MAERFLRTGAVQPEQRRGVHPNVKMIAAGIARFAAIVALAAGLSVGISLLIGWQRGSDLWRAAALGLYLGGALLIAIPLLSAGGRTHDTGGGYTYLEIEGATGRRAWQGTIAVYLAVGLALIGLGILLETLRS